MDRFDGDFYNDRDRTTRGASMHLPTTPNTEIPKTESDFGFGDFVIRDFREPADLLRDYDFDSHTIRSAMSATGAEERFSATFKVPTLPERFSATFTVPKLPDDPFFVLAATTIPVVLPIKAAPHEVGNVFLDFLDSGGIEATVTKVRPEKYWASANIFIEGRMVGIKVRIYHQEDGDVFPVEFQRRTGCALTFITIFKRAFAFYRSSKFSVLACTGQDSGKAGDSPGLLGQPHLPPSAVFSGVGDFGAPPPPPPLGIWDDGEVRLPPPPQMVTSPKDLAVSTQLLPVSGHLKSAGTDAAIESSFFSMMHLTDMPSLQAEAFNALAGVAAEQPDALALDTFVRGVQDLLSGNFPSDPEAEFAFAHLLAQVMQSGEVSRCFARNGTLALVADKVYASATSVVAKKQLARALVEASKNLSSAPRLEYGKVTKELEDTLTEDETMDGFVQEQLLHARNLLRAAVPNLAM